ncbi:unnamed protein product [Chrysoparadoxa australica]
MASETKGEEATASGTKEERADAGENRVATQLGQELLNAADNGNQKGVKDLLDKDANIIEAKDEKGWRALMFAARNGHIKVIDVLLEKGADRCAANMDNDTALIIAARHGHKEVIDALLKKRININAPNNVGWTALIMAAAHGHKECVLALLGGGAYIEYNNNRCGTALMLAAFYGRKEVVLALLEWKKKADIVNIEAATKIGNTALMYAARNGHKEVIDALLGRGAKKNTENMDNDTALPKAAQNGHKGVIDASSAKVAKIEAVNSANNDGKTALMYAVDHGHEEVVETLLEKGAKMDEAYTDSWTALMHAAWRGHKEVVNALLKRGAKIEATDKNGTTALMNAAKNNHNEAVDALLAKNANIEATDKKGTTALMLAASRGHAPALWALLKKPDDLPAVHVGARDNKGKTALMHARDFFSDMDRRSSTAEDWLSGWRDDSPTRMALALPPLLEKLASYDESGAKDIAREIILIIASKRGRLDVIEALLKDHPALDCRVPARLMALRLVEFSHEEDAKVSKAKEILEVLLWQSSGTYSFLDDMEDRNVVTEQHAPALPKNMGGAMGLKHVDNDPYLVELDKKMLPEEAGKESGPALERNELVKKDNSWKEDLRAARDKLEFAIQKRDGLLEVIGCLMSV